MKESCYHLITVNFNCGCSQNVLGVVHACKKKLSLPQDGYRVFVCVCTPPSMTGGASCYADLNYLMIGTCLSSIFK